MNDDKLDMLLSEAYSEPIYPSEELIYKTKSSVKRSDFLECVVASSIALNVIEAFIFFYMVLFNLHNVLLKIALLTTAAFIQNAILLVICLYKEEVKEVFSKFGTV